KPGRGQDVEPRRARAAMRSKYAGVRARAVLPDVVAELGERDALHVMELGARRGEVSHRRPRLHQQQTFVVLVFRIPRTTEHRIACRIGICRVATNAIEVRVWKRDRSICRASCSVEPGSLNEICLPWVK